MPEREIGILLKAYNNLGPGLSQATRAIESFASSSRHLLGGIGFAAGGAAAGIAILAKEAMDFDNEMLDIKTSGELTNKQMLGMRETIIDSSKEWGVSTDKMAHLSKAFIAASNDSEYFIKNAKFLGSVLAATRGSPEELGEGLGKLQKELKGTGIDYEKFIKTVFSETQAAGREKTFAKLLAGGEVSKLAKTYFATGKKDFEGLNKMMVEAVFTPDPGIIITAQKRIMKLLTAKPEHIRPGESGPLQQFFGLGFKPGDISKIGLYDILDKVHKKFGDTDEAAKALQFILGRSALDSKIMLGQFEKMEAAAKGIKINALNDQARENSEKMAASIEKMKASFTEIAVKLTPHLEKLFHAMATAIGDPKALKMGARGGIIAGGTVLTVAGLIAAFRTASAAKGPVGLPVGLGRLGTVGNPMYVIAVGGGLGAGGLPGTAGAGKGGLGRLGQAGLVVGTAVSAFEVTTQILKATGAYDALQNIGANIHKKVAQGDIEVTIEQKQIPGNFMNSPVK